MQSNKSGNLIVDRTQSYDTNQTYTIQHCKIQYKVINNKTQIKYGSNGNYQW